MTSLFCVYRPKLSKIISQPFTTTVSILNVTLAYAVCEILICSEVVIIPSVKCFKYDTSQKVQIFKEKKARNLTQFYKEQDKPSKQKSLYQEEIHWRKVTTQKYKQNIDYTRIEGHLRIVNASNDSHLTGVILPVIGSRPSHYPQKACYQKDTHSQLTATHALVQGLKESKQTIIDFEDQGLVSSEEVWTSPVIYPPPCKSECNALGIYTADEGSNTKHIVLAIITESYSRRWRRLTILESELWLWSSIVWRLDYRRRQNERFIQTHILEIFHQIWTNARSVT